MHKTFLLLRNNTQAGPFNLEELLQQDLKPTDLIWEEGRSAGWSNPNEIEVLRPFINMTGPAKEKQPSASFRPEGQKLSPSDLDTPFASKKVTSKSVYVSLPGHSVHGEEAINETPEETLEQKAEAIRKRALAASEHKTSHSVPQPLQPDYELETRLTRTTDEVGEDYSAWLYTRQVEKKKKARRRKSLAIISSVLCIGLAFGYFFIKGGTFGNEAESGNAVQHKDVDKGSGMIPEATLPGYVNETSVDESAFDSSQIIEHNTIHQNVDSTSARTRKKEVKHGLAAKPSPNPQPTEAAPVRNEVLPQGVAVNDQPADTVKASPQVAAVPEKKETLGDKIGNLFGKRKNKDKADQPASDQVDKEPGPPTNLINSVTVTANASSGNWMMGVHGLKLTLYNKSKETLKTAAVEILYYNDQKDLLEKKMVYFNNVPPKRSQTVVAPEHRLADHADYQLISAIAREEAYVKQ